MRFRLQVSAPTGASRTRRGIILTKLLEGDKGPMKHEGRKRTVRRSQGGAWGSRGVYLSSYPAATVYTKERSDLLHFSSPISSPTSFPISSPISSPISYPISSILSAIPWPSSFRSAILGQATIRRAARVVSIVREPHINVCWGEEPKARRARAVRGGAVRVVRGMGAAAAIAVKVRGSS